MSRSLFDSIQEIGERLSLAPHLFLCLDFDGTLTPSADDPALASLPLDRLQLLQSLSGHPLLSLAVISGRERSDLQGRLGVPGITYSGNHGLEISGPGFIFIEPTAVDCRGELQKLTADLTSRLQTIEGAVVEDKGLTISVHYRQAAPAQWEGVRRIVHAALANRNHPFQLTTGNMVFEVRPRVHWNKGDAVVWIKNRLATADALTIYFGDDTIDEDVFAALAEGITVKVGNGLPTTAHYQVETPDEVWRFLSWLEQQFGQQPLPLAVNGLGSPSFRE